MHEWTTPADKKIVEIVDDEEIRKIFANLLKNCRTKMATMQCCYSFEQMFAYKNKIEIYSRTSK